MTTLRASMFVFVALASCTGLAPSHYAEDCTTFCENRYTCFGDPMNQIVNCRPDCEATEARIAGTSCQSIADAFAACLAPLTCEQLMDAGAIDRECGDERTAFESACL